MIGVDKLAHLGAGALVAALALVLVHRLAPGWHAMALPGALAAAAAAGAAKEGYDHLANRKALKRGESPPHQVSWLDFFATAAGGALVWVAAAVGA